jgi:hypothetical protein
LGEGVVEAVGEGVQIVVEEAGVHVQRDRGRRVAEHLLHDLDVRAGR